MSIDGIIKRTLEAGENIEIILRPAIDDYFTEDGFHVVSSSIPGQSSLVILHPTWIPPDGLRVWGGSGSVIIESKPKPHNYKRIGYTRLQEDW